MDPRTVLNEVKRTWKPPAELLRSRPRELRLTGAGRALLSFAFIVLLAGLVGGAVMYVIATRDHDQRRELIQGGTCAQASVTRRWIVRGDHPSHVVQYAFQTEDGAFEGSVNVGRREWDRLEPGSVLTVRYLPANPRLHLVPGHADNLMPLWLPPMVGGIATLLAWFLRHQLVLQRRLLSEGRPAPGVVTHHTKTQHAKVAHYAFETLSGSVARGKSESKRKPPPEGSIVCVLYEPDRVSHNGVYPLPLVRTARR